MMINATKECTGCGACFNVCPRGAISMIPDAEGFKYPIINKDKCVQCGKCEKVCQNSKIKNEKPIMGVFAANGNNSIRLNSSSGGVFHYIATNVINNGGLICAASYNADFSVSHLFTDSPNEIGKFCGSKYVQSDVEDTYKKIKKELSNGRKVLFVGCPCQVDGLNAFLGENEKKNLILVDFICHGVPSPMIWAEYVKLKQKKFDGLKWVKFRSKKYGWNNYSLEWMDKTGKSHYEKRSDSLYLRGFNSNLFLRPSCYDCQHKGIHRHSDLTIADCWGIEKYQKAIDLADGLGTSLVICHSSKGIDLWNRIKDELHWTTYSIDEVVRYNASIEKCAVVNGNREAFFRDYHATSFVKLMKRYCNSTIKEKCINRLREVKHFIKD